MQSTAKNPKQAMPKSVNVSDVMINHILTNSANLPSDLIVEILLRLPVKSLLRFRCVCKSWFSFIKDPHFVKLHLTRSIENQANLNLILRYYFLDSELVGFCNGLLCIYNIDGRISLWNPSTRKCQKLPFTPIESLESSYIYSKTVYGFGFDPISDDYKVVKIFMADDDDLVEESEVKVYTLSTNSWRKVQDIPFNLRYKNGRGLFTNNALHWVAIHGGDTIVSFDLQDETCKEIPVPEVGNKYYLMDVVELGGCLSLLCNFRRERFEIWVMKEYCVTESWTNMYSIRQPEVIRSFDLRPLCISKNGELLLEQDNKKLSWYNPKNERVKNLKIQGIPKWFKAEIVVGSLVPLNDSVDKGYSDDDAFEENG